MTSRRGAGWFAAIDPLRQPLGRVKTVEAAVEAAGKRPGRRIVAFGFVDAPAEVAATLRLAGGDTEVLRVERVNLADDEPFALVTVWVRADIGADVSPRGCRAYDLLRPAAGARRGARLGATDDHRRDRRRPRPPRCSHARPAIRCCWCDGPLAT